MSGFDPLSFLYSELSSLANTVKNSVESELSGAEKSFVDNIFTPVVDVLDAGLSKLEQNFNNLGNEVGGELSSIVGNVSNGLTDIANATVKNISNTLGAVEQGFNILATDVSNSVSNTFNEVQNELNGLKDSLFQGLDQIAGDIGQSFQAISKEVTGTFTPIFEEIGAFLQAIPKDLTTVAEDIVGAVADIPKAVISLGEYYIKKDNLDEVFSRLAELPVDILNTARGVINTFLVPVMKELFAAAGFNANEITGNSIDRIIEVAVAQQVLQEAEQSLGAQGFIIANLIDRISDPLLSGSFRELEYAGNETNPNKLLDLDTLLVLFHRGVITIEDFKAELLKDGLSETAADQILVSSYRLNDISALVQAYFRGIITSSDDFSKRAAKLGFAGADIQEFLEISKPVFGENAALQMWRRGVLTDGDKDPFDDMRRAGWTEERIASFKAISYNLPNIFELQDFKVRRVDDQAIVDKFQLDALIDEDYFAGAEKLGYTRKDAQRYYRYYWEYPPFFQVARLYTGGHVPEQDFRDILGFLRFSPYFIDKLADDLKPQLTVAEIEKMYKYQVIGEDDIVPRLTAMHVPKDLAEQYKELWIASVKLANPLESTSAKEAALKTQGLTLSLILMAYKDGVETATDAAALMSEIGIGADEAALHLKIADYQVHKDNVTQELADIKADVAAGLTTANDAVIALQKLGITPTQIDRYAAEFLKMTTRKPKIPTLAELTAWIKKGFITLSEYVTGLQIIGYDDSWIPYYLLAAGATADEISSLGLSATTALTSNSNVNAQSNNTPASGGTSQGATGGDATGSEAPAESASGG